MIQSKQTKEIVLITSKAATEAEDDVNARILVANCENNKEMWLRRFGRERITAVGQLEHGVGCVLVSGPITLAPGHRWLGSPCTL
jgi:hypothetical protein